MNCGQKNLRKPTLPHSQEPRAFRRPGGRDPVVGESEIAIVLDKLFVFLKVAAVSSSHSFPGCRRQTFKRSLVSIVRELVVLILVLGPYGALKTNRTVTQIGKAYDRTIQVVLREDSGQLGAL